MKNPKTDSSASSPVEWSKVIRAVKAVVMGSHNLTGAGIKTNRDASLIIYNQEAIDFFERLFLYDWRRARPGHARLERDARLAVPGEPTPPGFVRVRWSDYVDA